MVQPNVLSNQKLLGTAKHYSHSPVLSQTGSPLGVRQPPGYHWRQAVWPLLSCNDGTPSYHPLNPLSDNSPCWAELTASGPAETDVDIIANQASLLRQWCKRRSESAMAANSTFLSQVGSRYYTHSFTHILAEHDSFISQQACINRDILRQDKENSSVLYHCYLWKDPSSAVYCNNFYEDCAFSWIVLFSICCHITDKHNDVLTILTCNFSKEQYVFPEDDLRIETCRSILSVLM